MRAIFAIDGMARGAAEGEPRAVLPADLAPEGGVARARATTRVALSPTGPFSPIADALEASATLRELFVAALEPACAKTYRRVRFTIVLALVPLLLLAELDRELWVVGARGAGAHLVVDLVVLAFAAADFPARAPRHPKTTALVLVSTAARYAALVAKPCGDAAPIFWTCGAVALVGAVALLVIAPSPSRVVVETLRLLAIPEADARALRRRMRPSPGYLASALGVAVALPALLWLSRWAHLSMIAQMAVFAGYAAVVPTAVELYFERGVLRATRDWRAVVLATALGFTLTVAATDASRHALDAAAFVQKCVDPSAFEASATKRLLDAQSREVVRSSPDDGGRWAMLLLNVLVVPLVEERVYRSLLQRVLSARVGSVAGIAGAALVFGLAHLGVYRVAIYQTTILGAAFGVAYGAGGLAAAAAVHALWNLRSSV